jgi:hypothetical protein
MPDKNFYDFSELENVVTEIQENLADAAQRIEEKVELRVSRITINLLVATCAVLTGLVGLLGGLYVQQASIGPVKTIEEISNNCLGVR